MGFYFAINEPRTRAPLESILRYLRAAAGFALQRESTIEAFEADDASISSLSLAASGAGWSGARY